MLFSILFYIFLDLNADQFSLLHFETVTSIRIQTSQLIISNFINTLAVWGQILSLTKMYYANSDSMSF